MSQAVIAARAALLLLGSAAVAQAQGAAPLRKSDLVRLLANPLIQRQEIAVVVRRNCLSFRPTERDWSDLRTLGADSDVLGSVGACAARGAQRPAPPGAGALPSTSLVAAFLTPRVAVAAGNQAFVPIQVKRADGTQARSVAVVLRATSYLPGGPSGELKAVTDDSGFSVFGFQVGRLAGRYRLELVGGGSAGGAPFLGRPVIDLFVSPGPPAAAEVQPSRLELGRPGEPAAGLLVTVRDSFGNAVPREPIELHPTGGAAGLRPDSGVTDSLGRASFLVPPAALREPGQLEVRVSGVRLVSLEVANASPPPPPLPVSRPLRSGAAAPPPSAPIPTVRAGFVPGPVQRGLAQAQMADALTFEVREISGQPLPGKSVLFRAVNAQVEPDSAVTDSAGRVQLQVRLGSRAGIAILTAFVDSLKRHDTLHVEPGAATELVLEREGVRVDGGRILVELGVPFDVTVRARDRYGNAAPTASLTGRLQELRASFNARPERRLELLAVQPQDLASVLTFKPVRLGGTDLLIDVGLRATLSVQVQPASR